MDVSSLNYLYVLIVMLACKVTRTAGVCHIGHAYKRLFSDTIVNHTLVGPVMSSITAMNERECERECHLAVPDLCYMFNYYPSSKVCELLYKDRAAECKVEKEKGATFKTRKCPSNPCLLSQHCVALGDQNNILCLNFTGRISKANTAPVCIGTVDDSYGTFFAPADGEINTFKLVHISGGVSVKEAKYQGNWGTTTTQDPELHITDHRNVSITPPSGYPVNKADGLLRYDVPGFTNMSPELVFPEIFPPLAVTKGKEFRIWFGQDLTNVGESNNSGTTCADVFVIYHSKQPLAGDY